MAIEIPHKPRDSYFDILKVILITLVVVAHFAEMYARIRSMHGLLNMLTAFIIPVHMFIVWPITQISYMPVLTEVFTVIVPIVITYFLSHDAVVGILQPFIRATRSRKH